MDRDTQGTKYTQTEVYSEYNIYTEKSYSGTQYFVHVYWIQGVTMYRRGYWIQGVTMYRRGYWIQGEHIYRIGYNRIHKDVLVRINK